MSRRSTDRYLLLNWWLVLLLDGEDELVGECLRRHVDDLHIGKLPAGRVADGLDEVGLSQADAAVDQAGVVACSGVLGDREGGVGGKGVVFADDEPLEGVLLVELGVLAPPGRGVVRPAVLASVIVRGLAPSRLLDPELDRGSGDPATRGASLRSGGDSAVYLVLVERRRHGKHHVRVPQPAYSMPRNHVASSCSESSCAMSVTACFQKAS